MDRLETLEEILESDPPKIPLEEIINKINEIVDWINAQ
tara:strand:- start:319 stop:432 length:114 start_codon:yes stop_codon:yes gene_type:complete